MGCTNEGLQEHVQGAAGHLVQASAQAAVLCVPTSRLTLVRIASACTGHEAITPESRGQWGCICDSGFGVQTMRNLDTPATDIEAPAPHANAKANVLAISFSALFDALVPRLNDAASLLLLYNLLVHCRSFLDAMLVRSDAEALLVPLLKQLYQTLPEQAHHMYLLQVCPVLVVCSALCQSTRPPLCTVC